MKEGSVDGRLDTSIGHAKGRKGHTRGGAKKRWNNKANAKETPHDETRPLFFRSSGSFLGNLSHSAADNVRSHRPIRTAKKVGCLVRSSVYEFSRKRRMGCWGVLDVLDDTFSGKIYFRIWRKKGERNLTWSSSAAAHLPAALLLPLTPFRNKQNTAYSEMEVN